MVKIDRDQAANTASAYLAQIKHLPLWAIEAGCQSCIARNNPFPPSAGELRAACENAVQPLRDEEAEIRKVLEAEIYHSAPKAERERITKGFGDLIAELKHSNAMERKPDGKAHKRTIYGTDSRLSDHALAAFQKKVPAGDIADGQ